MKEWRVAVPAKRLDSWMANQPGIGSLRFARRLISDGNIKVNGLPCRPATRLQPDDLIEMLDMPAVSSEKKAQFVGRQGDYYFFYKPGGLHTVALAGRANASLEAQLPVLSQLYYLPAGLVLLQRLDFATSGLIAAALGKESAYAYREEERAGRCRKFYLAALSGHLESPLVVKNSLRGNGRRMKVGPEVVSKLAWTQFKPLWYGFMPHFGESVTIAQCQLGSGQRHQIRAHAAYAGYPLVGDDLYGGTAGQGFLLEHYKLCFPDHEFRFHAPDARLNNMLKAECGSVWEALCM